MAPTRAGKPDERLVPVEGNVSCIPMLPCWWHLILWPYTLVQMIIAARGADVVRVRIMEYMYLLAAFAAWVTSKPTYFYIGASPFTSALTSPRFSRASWIKRLRAHIDQWLVRMVVRNKLVVCSDKGLAEELSPWASRSFGYRMSNVLEPDDFVDPNSIDCEWADPPNVLVVGTLNPGKGIQDLLRAMTLLAEEGLDVGLRLAGDGGYRQTLAELADELGLSEHVEFLGFLNRDQLKTEYRSADIFCLASHSEGSPKVVPEAMAAGLPTIATNVGNVSNIIEDSETGVICEPQNVESLAAALRRLLGDRDFALRIARAGRMSMEGTGLDPDSREFMGVVAAHLGLEVKGESHAG
jgi:glycosyltransferase involved in cell wall biosynthesis